MFGLFAVDHICFWIVDVFKGFASSKSISAVVVLLTLTKVDGIVFYKKQQKIRGIQEVLHKLWM